MHTHRNSNKHDIFDSPTTEEADIQDLKEADIKDIEESRDINVESDECLPSSSKRMKFII